MAPGQALFSSVARGGHTLATSAGNRCHTRQAEGVIGREMFAVAHFAVELVFAKRVEVFVPVVEAEAGEGIVFQAQGIVDECVCGIPTGAPLPAIVSVERHGVADETSIHVGVEGETAVLVCHDRPPSRLGLFSARGGGRERK